jgi:hypothetical protein
LLRPGVVSQFALLLKAISSLGALTCFYLQVYQVAALSRRHGPKARKMKMRGRMVSAKPYNVKLLVALIGGSGVIAVGALSMAFGQEQAGQVSVAKSSGMNIGSTSTETTPALVPATTMAQPAMKGPAPLPTEEQAPAAP